MIATVQAVSYFYATVPDRPDDACRLLSQLAGAGVNLLAFAAIPLGPEHTQLVLFPDNPQRLTQIADSIGFVVTGPQRAFLAQGDDRLGAIAAATREPSRELSPCWPRWPGTTAAEARRGTRPEQRGDRLL